ncbi:hypothetical protein FACS189474_0310 [Bacteroidia bacterium]|nr:hypothetical protein FACS189474_0310 [Bacteroidia bacterium]
MLLDFDELAIESQKILSSEYSSDMVNVFYQNGGSSGGARPKIFTKIDGKQWLVKFKAAIDPENIGKIEYEYADYRIPSLDYSDSSGLRYFTFAGL